MSGLCGQPHCWCLGGLRPQGPPGLQPSALPSDFFRRRVSGRWTEDHGSRPGLQPTVRLVGGLLPSRVLSPEGRGLPEEGVHRHRVLAPAPLADRPPLVGPQPACSVGTCWLRVGLLSPGVSAPLRWAPAQARGQGRRARLPAGCGAPCPAPSPAHLPGGAGQAPEPEGARPPPLRLLPSDLRPRSSPVPNSSALRTTAFAQGHLRDPSHVAQV